MKLPFSEKIERGRVRHQTLVSVRGDDFGYFKLRRRGPDAELVIIASSGRDKHGAPLADIPWEHVSVSTKTRCPTWEEMAWVKSLFFEDEEAVMQLHPPLSQHVNYHPFCLHLWRPLVDVLPLPPAVAVGPLGETMP